MRFLGALPTENGAELALCMEHEWPELNDFVSLEELAQTYNAEITALENATRALLRRGLLEKKEETRTLLFFFLIPYQATVAVYKRALTSA